MIVILFWLCIGLILYPYLLFPVIVLLRGLVRPRPVLESAIEPYVSVIIVAHNEANSIGEKLENILSLDYPEDQLEVLVASDGSNDGTNEIVESCADVRVRLLVRPREGKIPALNAAASVASGEVLVFSDANSMFAKDALRALVEPFGDAGVGGVAGDQRYLDGAAIDSVGERAYWSFDRFMKMSQSRSGSVTSATGAIYSIRSSLFQTVPLSVTDDFYVSTGVVAQGHRLVFSSRAVAYEPVAAGNRVEFGRKVRVMTRGLWGVLARRCLLNPIRHGFYAIQLFSHKVARRLVVFPLLALLLVTPFLWSHGPLYQVLAILQAAICVASAIGMILEHFGLPQRRIFGLSYFFAMVNAAALRAVWNVLSNHRIDTWNSQRAVDRLGGETLDRPITAYGGEVNT